MVSYIGIHYGQEIQMEVDTLKTTVIAKPNIPPAPEADQDATMVQRREMMQDTISQYQSALDALNADLKTNPN